MYKVIKLFKDKYNGQIYKIGDVFECDDTARINDLINRGLIEGEVQPSYNSLTKKEIVELLEEKGIAYNARAKKEELIELLQGGD